MIYIRLKLSIPLRHTDTSYLFQFTHIPFLIIMLTYQNLEWAFECSNERPKLC